MIAFFPALLGFGILGWVARGVYDSTREKKS